MDNNPYSRQQRHLRQAFDRAANTYDKRAALQQAVQENLLEQLSYMRIEPSWVLDLGSGTGGALACLQQYFPSTQIAPIDLSYAMLHKAGSAMAICGAAEDLPVADATMDLVFSNLMLQWSNDLAQTLREVARVLRPQGLFLFSSLGPGTLHELHSSWAAVDNEPHVNQFVDMHDVGDLLVQSGLSDPVLEMETIVLMFADVYQLMRELKQLGAYNINQGRRKGLTGKHRLQQMVQHYQQFKVADKIPASYEVIYGHAWKGATTESHLSDDASVVNLDRLHSN